MQTGSFAYGIGNQQNYTGSIDRFYVCRVSTGNSDRINDDLSVKQRATFPNIYLARVARSLISGNQC